MLYVIFVHIYKRALIDFFPCKLKFRTYEETMFVAAAASVNFLLGLANCLARFCMDKTQRHFPTRLQHDNSIFSSSQEKKYNLELALLLHWSVWPED